VRAARKGPLLQPSALGEHGELLGLNLTQGCIHRCAFCSVRGHPAYTGDKVVTLSTDIADRLETELLARRKRPRAVFISPSTDPFPPQAEVQSETVRAVETLARHGVEAWLMTRGYIRPAALDMLAAQRERVRVTVGLTTLDRSLQRILEPLAAPPRLRLRQIVRLRGLGIAVQVAVEPLIPGLTDTRESLSPLLEALAKAGVRHVSAGYLFLRSGISDNLVNVLEGHGWSQMVLDAFQGGPILSAGHSASARYLPKLRRQRGYAALMAMAAAHGLTVSVCGNSNPDFRVPRPSAANRRAAMPLFAATQLKS
jgi:DNA repair photolyase